MGLAWVDLSFGGRLVLDLADIGARGEVSVRTCQHHGAAESVAREFAQGCGEALKKRRVQRVPGFGPVEGEERPALAVFHNQVHAASSPRIEEVSSLNILNLKYLQSSVSLGLGNDSTSRNPEGHEP